MKRYLLLCIIGALYAEQDLHEQKFTSIYQRGCWGKNERGEGESGWGSKPDVCQPYMIFVQDFIREHNITSVVDAGCGDWLFSRYMNWSGINYIGYDVVELLITRNNANFANEHINFVHGNFLKIDLPPADLFLCKDVFQHLCHADILAFLPQLKKYKYCLITNHVDADSLSSGNFDSGTAEFHNIDICKAPFNLPGKAVLHYKVWNEVHQVVLVENKDL
jgi:SAM-dependent methyltransferase